MTLVAAFKISGVPVLLGDFLLTDNIARKNHIFLPTAPHLAKRAATRGGRRICGLRKKIHKIGERLVVGFTGSLHPGAVLIRRLHKRFGRCEITIPDLKQFLAKEQFPRKSETELIGWVWENRTLCFHWRGKAPEQFSIVNSIFTGSGARHFQNEVMHTDQKGLSEEIQTAVDKAVYVGTCQAGKVLLQELIHARNIDHAYGFGAEIIVWDGGRFRYVENIAYGFWNILVRQDNSLQVAFSNVAAVYRNFDEYSVMQITHLGPKKNPAECLEAKDTYVQVITPIYDDMKSFDVRSVGRQSFESNLWFSGIIVSNPVKNIQATYSMVSECRDGIEPFAQYRNGVVSINVRQLYNRLPQSLFN
jgi:hypothetical protein